jgi:hypothetical protein
MSTSVTTSYIHDQYRLKRDEIQAEKGAKVWGVSFTKIMRSNILTPQEENEAGLWDGFG